MQIKYNTLQGWKKIAKQWNANNDDEWNKLIAQFSQMCFNKKTSIKKSKTIDT